MKYGWVTSGGGVSLRYMKGEELIPNKYVRICAEKLIFHFKLY